MIRHATVEDAVAIAKIHVRTWQTAYAEIFPAEFLANLSVEKRTAAWLDLLADNQSTTIVAESDGVIAGWASGGVSRDADAADSSELHAIYVLPEYWDKGIGAKLLLAIDAILSQPLTTTLWVLRDNERALRFYEKFGFIEDGAQTELERGSVKRWEIRMRKTRRKIA